MSRAVNSFENIDKFVRDMCSLLYVSHGTQSKYSDIFKVYSFYIQKGFCFDEILYSIFKLGFIPQDAFYRLYRTPV